MKLDLTKNEYRNLLEMLYISDWVLHAFSSDAIDETSKHKQVQEKLLSLHQELGAEELMAEYESNQFDEQMHENYLEPYNQNVFWETLIDQLSFRDLVAQIGIEEFEKLDPLKRIEKLDEFRQVYSKEFEKNQLSNLKINKA